MPLIASSNLLINALFYFILIIITFTCAYMDSFSLQQVPVHTALAQYIL